MPEIIPTPPDTTALKVGVRLPDFVLPPVTRTRLALYAGASGDHNPMHIDLDFARAAGYDDVFAHGMFVMAGLGRALTHWLPRRRLRGYGVRFRAITHVGDEIRCTAEVAERIDDGGVECYRLTLQAADQRGEVKLAGHAVVAADDGAQPWA